MTPDRDLECAEYVLGVLEVQERMVLERALGQDAVLRACVHAWQTRLSPLGEDAASLQPPARVWKRIQADLGHARSVKSPARASQVREVWNSLRLWRAVALATSFAMVCLVALNVSKLPSTGAPSVAKSNYMVASITGDSGLPHWTMTIDTARREIVVVPAVAVAVSDNASTELWLIPENSKPISLGVFSPDKATAMTLPEGLAVKVNARAVLAVSLEPKGGSPTGQPTGRVLGKGGMQQT